MRPISRAGLCSLLAAGLAGLAACDLETSGVDESVDSGVVLPPADGGGRADSSVQPDAPADVAMPDVSVPDVPVLPEAGPTCGGGSTCLALPAGWSLVAFAGSTQTTCPSGYSQAPTDVVEGAQAPANACACDGTCAIGTQPTCTSGQIALDYDSDGTKSCGTPYFALTNANAGACNTDNFHGAIPTTNDAKFTPAGPQGGACTASPPTKHRDRLTFAARGRVCSPDTTSTVGCDAGSCTPGVASPFAVCVAHGGDQACPAGFTKKHLVGTDAQFDCGGTCGCAVSAKCSGTVTYYTDSACTNGALVMQADGTCRNQGASGGTYGSYKYQGTASNVACAPTGTAAAPTNVGLVNAETVCCP